MYKIMTNWNGERAYLDNEKFLSYEIDRKIYLIRQTTSELGGFEVYRLISENWIFQEIKVVLVSSKKKIVRIKEFIDNYYKEQEGALMEEEM